MIDTSTYVIRHLRSRAKELHDSKREKASYFVFCENKNTQLSHLRKVLGDEGYTMKIGNTYWKATEVK